MADLYYNIHLKLNKYECERCETIWNRKLHVAPKNQWQSIDEAFNFNLVAYSKKFKALRKCNCKHDTNLSNSYSHMHTHVCRVYVNYRIKIEWIRIRIYSMELEKTFILLTCFILQRWKMKKITNENIHNMWMVSLTQNDRGQKTEDIENVQWKMERKVFAKINNGDKQQRTSFGQISLKLNTN